MTESTGGRRCDAPISDEEMAQIIYDAFERTHPGELLSGAPPFRFPALIDGQFNLRRVAKHVKHRLGLIGKPPGPSRAPD